MSIKNTQPLLIQIPFISSHQDQDSFTSVFLKLVTKLNFEYAKRVPPLTYSVKYNLKYNLRDEVTVS